MKNFIVNTADTEFHISADQFLVEQGVLTLYKTTIPIAVFSPGAWVACVQEKEVTADAVAA